MPFTAIWTDLEIIILSEVRARAILYDILCMQNLKRNDTSELIHKTNKLTDLENNLMVTREEG